MDCILTSIKKMLGIDKEYTHFDSDIITHINSVFMVLTQLGVGPSEGFAIEDDRACWADFVSESESIQLGALKSYVYMKVKLLFDPPLSSSVMDSMKNSISEFEWRLNIAAEHMKTSKEENV